MSTVYDDLPQMHMFMRGRDSLMIVTELKFTADYHWNDDSTVNYEPWQAFVSNVAVLKDQGIGLTLWATQSKDPTIVQFITSCSKDQARTNENISAFLVNLQFYSPSAGSINKKVILKESSCLYPFAEFLAQQPRVSVLSMGYFSRYPFTSRMQMPMRCSFTFLRFTPAVARKGLESAHGNMILFADAVKGVNGNNSGVLQGIYTAVQDKDSAEFELAPDHSQIIHMHWLIWEKKEHETAWKDGTMHREEFDGGVPAYNMYQRLISSADIFRLESSYWIKPIRSTDMITTETNDRKSSTAEDLLNHGSEKSCKCIIL